jgi:nitrate reductase NapAB chaperone NapD
MSGPTCHDCGNPYITHSDNASVGAKPAKCTLCGWEGDISGDAREELTEEGYVEYDEQMRLKKEGKLFYIRILVDGDDHAKTRAAFDTMKIIHTVSTTTRERDGKAIVLARVDARPTADQIEKIKNLTGVIEVHII